MDRRGFLAAAGAAGIGGALVPFYGSQPPVFAQPSQHPRKPRGTPTPTPSSTPSGFPDATNTGVPAGTSLTSYSGPSTITTDGTTVDSKIITSCIVIQADNVTFTKCLFQSNGCFWNVLNEWDGGANLLIEDCEIDGLVNTSGDAALNLARSTVRRCNIHGTLDGAKFGSTGVLVEDSYIHDLVVFGDSHNDGIQCLETIGLTIRHNTIICPAGGTSAIILSTGSGADMRNILIENNLLA